MKRFITVALVFSFFLIAMPINVCFAGSFEESVNVTPRYAYTDEISADLSFSGNYAVCSGSIAPLYTNDVSLVVTLYQLVNDRWEYVDSWSGSSKAGLAASAGGRALVSFPGTYKVTVVGNVDDLEYPTQSVTWLPYGNGHRMAIECAEGCQNCVSFAGSFYSYESDMLSHVAGGTGDEHLSSTDFHMFYYICKYCNAHYGTIYKDCFADTTNVHVSHAFHTDSNTKDYDLHSALK